MEIWKDIEGFEGLYQISNLGNVKRISGKRQGLLKPYKHHLRVYIQFKVDGKHICFKLDKLVAKHFLNYVDETKHIEHLDNDIFNNAVSNLVISEKTEKEYICEVHREGNNKYWIDDNIAHVELPNTHKEMICDIDDWEILKEYTWFDLNGYAESGKMLFHRMVMKPPKGMVIDHINRNRYDNRKENLRITTTRVNNINRDRNINSKTGVYGVNLTKNNKYTVRIRYKGKKLYIGVFDSLEEAKQAREKAEIKYHHPIIEEETLQTGCFFNT